MISNNQHTRRGFTIIELTLVMAAMSIMLLAILYATLHAGALYDKGITNRTVNQMSRDISDMFRRDFATIDPSKVQFVTTGTAPNTSGRLCLGSISYLWNTAPLLNTAPATGIKTSTGTPLVFVRVTDPGSYYCSPAGGPYPTTLLAGATVTNVLSGTGRDFAVYSFAFPPATISGAQGIFELKLTVGTNEQGTTQAAAGTTQCRPATDNSSDFNYCSIVDLDIIVRSGGKN